MINWFQKYTIKNIKIQISLKLQIEPSLANRTITLELTETGGVTITEG